MNIGIDIDNTISTTREAILEVAERLNQENNRTNQFDLSYYNLEKSLGWDRPTTQHFLTTYLADIYRQVQPKPHAIEVIKEIHAKHQIILITSRNQRNESITDITLNWLNQHGIAYDKLVMNRTDNMHHFSKLAACLENGVELMIEDHHDLAMEISTRLPVILFDYPYNAHLVNDRIIRVQDWLQVRETISLISKQTTKGR